MTRNWNAYPFLFRAVALTTGTIAIVMSLLPPVVYAGMAPVIRSEVLLREFIWRTGPILLVYLLALVAAMLLDPVRRPFTGAALLTATLPAVVALMLYGLR